MPAHDIAGLLKTTPAFSDLSPDICQKIASLFGEQTLAPGAVLAKEGDRGDALFLIVEGSIALQRLDRDSVETTYLGTLGRGEVVGELSLLTGHPRAATMTANEASVIASLSRRNFDSLCLEFPRGMEGVIAWMRRRFYTYQIKTVIDENPFLKELSAAVKSELEGAFEWTEMRSGEVLFRQGELGNALYLVISGRIQLLQSHAGEEENQGLSISSSEQVLTELGNADMLGEMALLTNEPRSATARAIRDTQLACLSRASFDRITAAYPKEILGLLARQMAERLRNQNLGKGAHRRPPVSIAVLVCSRLARDFAPQLAKSLSAFGTTSHLNRESINTQASDLPLASDTAEARLLAWLNDQETLNRHVVYEADAVEDSWTFRCLRQADVLFVAVDAKENPRSIAARLQPLLQRAEHPLRLHIALYHSDPSLTPAHTDAWLNAIEAVQHWHLRSGIKDDVSRIARYLTGCSVGLTLGGGFAFGLAHIGAIQALREMEIPIDHVGGTSMGSVISMACAFHFSRQQMLGILQEGCAGSLKGDYTFPIVSLLTGRKVARSIGAYVGDINIEDLWLPYFAISSSLVHARMVVHTRGNALRSVLASCRAPGMFPPLGWNDDVLVDGGLVNNVPCDVMRDQVGPGTVIAVDVSPSADFSVREQFDMHLSGWRVARRKANPFSRQPKPITIADILARLVRFGGVAQLRQIRSSADIYLMPPLETFTFRDFHRGEEMSQVGYEHTLEKMRQWIAMHGRPWAGDAKD